jgi:peptide/nickel transport system permease protein
MRVLGRHLLPAARGFMAVQVTVLLPAFIVAEATLSFVGLGFPDPTASWGTMLHDASNVRVFADFPWLLSPAVAIFVVVLALNLVLERADGLRVRVQSG